MIKEAEKRGLPIPAEYADPPFYDQSKLIFMLAFQDLNLDRPISRGVIARIRREDVWRWADDYGMGDDIHFKIDLLAHIRELDRVWIDIELERLAKENKRGTGKLTNGKKNLPAKLRPTS